MPLSVLLLYKSIIFQSVSKTDVKCTHIKARIKAAAEASTSYDGFVPISSGAQCEESI